MTTLPRLTARELEGIRAPLQPRAVLGAWIASAPTGIASHLRLEDVLSRYPRGLRPLVTSRQGLPLFGRDELIALLQRLNSRSAANLLAHLQQADLVLPRSAVVTEASAHAICRRLPLDPAA